MNDKASPSAEHGNVKSGPCDDGSNVTVGQEPTMLLVAFATGILVCTLVFSVFRRK